MESRKYLLQKQIIEAKKANDNGLYTLLKSQWAHRYGVDSLEELQNLDLNEVTEHSSNERDEKNDKSQDYLFEDEKQISLEKNDNQEKEVTNDNKKVIQSDKVENQESFENKSYKIVYKENNDPKPINPVIDYKKSPEVKALIPIPPKPKYSYLKKWLLRI